LSTKLINASLVLNYLGSVDYVFTYLRNSVLENAVETITIQVFVEHRIHSHAYLNDSILCRPPFSTIQLRYIIDLYELLEENAFDQVLRAYKKELVEETFSDEERQRILETFLCETFEKEIIAETSKTIDCWISMLKRLMIRVLDANVSLDVPLQLYLERTDLWSDPVTDVDLATFRVDDDTCIREKS
jgi:transcriptional regulatory protein LevR